MTTESRRVRSRGRPWEGSKKSGRGSLPPVGVYEFGTFTSGFCTGAGRSRHDPADNGAWRVTPGRQQAASWGNTCREVGPGRSTREVGEDAGNSSRVDGGKAQGRGKVRCTKRILGTARARCAH